MWMGWKMVWNIWVQFNISIINQGKRSEKLNAKSFGKVDEWNIQIRATLSHDWSFSSLWRYSGLEDSLAISSISCSLLISIYYCNGFSLWNSSHLGHNINKQNPAKLPNLEPNIGCVSAKEVAKCGYYHLKLLPKECIPIACAPPPQKIHALES